MRAKEWEPSRREFLGTAAVATTATCFGLESSAKQPPNRLKVAAVVTEYRKTSHAQHIVDRFLHGYDWEGEHHRPNMDVVSLYVDQRPRSDLSQERATRFPGMKVYPTIAEALTLGGSKLAVDGVILVGEHGRYRMNEKRQTLYPRYEFFKQIVEVYKQSGRTAPLFNDKHLSWNWDWAKEMVATSKAMGFGFLAGSSVPWARRLPEVDIPFGAEVEEAMCITLGQIDSYDIHALEGLQCMLERRKGGETGVKWIQAYRGEAVWEAFRQKVWDSELFEACLCRSHRLTSPQESFSHRFPTYEEMARMVSRPVAYHFEYVDGTKGTIMLMPGLVGDFTFAARLKNQKDPISTCMYLPYFDVVNFFSPLVHQIETLFETKQSPYFIERTLLTTGLTAMGVESLAQGGKRLDTPDLAAIHYQPRPESLFWRT